MIVCTQPPLLVEIVEEDGPRRPGGLSNLALLTFRPQPHRLFIYGAEINDSLTESSGKINTSLLLPADLVLKLAGRGHGVASGGYLWPWVVTLRSTELGLGCFYLACGLDLRRLCLGCYDLLLA